MEQIQHIRNLITWAVCLLAVPPMLFCLGAWIYTSPHWRTMFASLTRQFRSLPVGGKLLAIVLLATFIVMGSTKTNSVPPPAPPATPPDGGRVVEDELQIQPEDEGFSADGFLDHRLTTNQYLAGFALVRVHTNAVVSLAPPSNATVHTPWTRYGVAEDTFWLPATNWAFILGTNQVEGVHVSSSGTLSFGWPKGSPRAREMPDGSSLDFLAPLQTAISIVPPVGRFWHAPTSSNSLLLTWQDVYLNRDTNLPVSFQSELFANGDFTFRYGLDASSSYTNFVIGAQHNGGGETFAFSDTNRLVNGLELRWRAFGLLDPGIDDHDGDGLSTYDEVMIHGTDPRLTDSDLDGLTDGVEVAAGSNPMRRDTDGDGLIDGSDPDPLNATSLEDADGDGIPDAYEIWRFGSTNTVNALTADITANGFLLATEIAAGLDPHRVAAPVVFPTNNLAAWQLCDPFAATFASGTNLVYQRTFQINRTAGWQQYFISAASNAPAGWSLDGMTLEWQDSEGTSGFATASSGDSLWLPLSTNNPATLTLRLRGSTASTRCPQPLHLLVWSPGIALAGGISASTNDVECTVVNLNDGGNLSASFDRANRPCLAPPSVEELAATAAPFTLLDAGLKFSAAFGADGAASGGNLKITTPGLRNLPTPMPSTASPNGRGVEPAAETANRLAYLPTALSGDEGGGSTAGILLAISPVLTWGDGLHGWRGCGDRVHYDPASGAYGEIFEYPLDSGCLWRNWWRDSNGGYTCTCEPRVSFGDSSLDAWFQTDFDYLTDDHVEATVTLGGTFIWRDEAWHQTDTDGGCYEQGVELLSSDACDDCYGCENGNCDGFEGPTTGSLAFRIPLGTPRQGQVSGFLWFRTDEPMTITPAVFSLSTRSDAALQAESNNVSQTISRINCTDERGRDLRIAPMASGVRITVSNAPCTILEHTWEITNEGGSPSQIRLRKISRLHNTMSDHTYTCDDGVWTCFDNIAQASETVTKTGDLNDPAHDTLREERVVKDAAATVLSHTIVESRRFGVGETAVIREISRREKAHGADNWQHTYADYWSDIGNPRRHGRPKVTWGDDRSWCYQTWDERGRQTLRLDPWDGSACPTTALQGDTSLTLTNLPSGIVCNATIPDYAPHTGDSSHSDDLASPRTVTVRLVRDGATTVISRIWHIYAHATNTYAEVTRRTIRACSATATINDPGNAVSTETVCHTDALGVPLLMRGRPLSAIDENGVTTTYAYALGSWNNESQTFLPEAAGPHLRTITRRSYRSNPFDTSQLTIQDATHGVTLHSATLLTADDTPLDWQTHAYDDKNRLRATQYADGSFSTNAYSCCRLLWTMDRDGNKVLRSAETGKDHLYYATEEVSLRELTEADPCYYAPARYFRVTQHFMDAFGRETNTTTRTSRYEGTATVPGFTSPAYPSFTDTTTYPDGTADYRIHTDRRGVRTVSWNTSFSDRDMHVTQTYHPTNLTIHVLLASNITWRNGRSVSLQSWDSGWTRETSMTEFTVDGHRRDIAISETSDLPGTITNRLTSYDFLGRTVATLTPGANGTWLVTSNTYDSTSHRLIYAENIGRPTVTYLYNQLGENVGTVQNGITSATDTRYATISNQIWRVTLQSTAAGGVTSAVASIRQQLTGLSNELRSRAVGIAANGSVSTTETSFNPASKTLTTTAWTDDGTPTIGKSKFGALIETRTLSARTARYYDAFLTPYHVRAYHPVGGTLISKRLLALDVETWDPVYTETRYGSTIVTGETSYDAWGREIIRTDALGNAVTNVYDALGRRVAISGATYPLNQSYDTAGRKTSLATTRNGDVWDTTQWFHDRTTGLTTNKVYADNSCIAYTHMLDGKLLRTIWARGAWRETAYNDLQLPNTVSYSGATPAVFYTYDTFGLPTTASNAVAQYAYANSALGAATNEAVVIGTKTYTLTRSLDSRHRPAVLAIQNDAAPLVHYTYDDENRLSGVSNTVFVATYAYAIGGWDAGYTVALTDGTILSRHVTRDPYRRHLVAAITNTVGQNVVSGDRYVYDLLGRAIARNADTFDYNDRSEVTAAIIQLNNSSRYEYDKIGNNVCVTINAATNIYTANALNQYEAIQAVPLAYDPDGNLLANSPWSYTWDAENRLTAVYSNSACVVSNAYDHMSRRVLKVTPTATHAFVYDGWDLVQETVSDEQSTTTNRYVWGKDLSGSRQGAGGIGGLLAVNQANAWYFPFYDNNGNITAYVDESGAVVAFYDYDAFGATIAQYGPLADAFPHRFSTKYFDIETGLYYYGYRFYAPELMRLLNRDPVAEAGGMNLYAFCHNNGIGRFDPLGLYEKVALGTGIGFSMSFSGQGKPQFAAMLVGSLKQSPCENLRFNADVGIRLLRGGAIGEPRNSTDWTYEVFGAISGTIGKSNGKSVPFYFNGTQWGSALGDTYGSSLSVGQTVYYNSALNETPRMGLIRLQSGGVFFNYNNDQKRLPFGLGDSGDRGWTGGGALGFSIGDGSYAIMGFDDFTGRADETVGFNPSYPNRQNLYSGSLNQAQWTLGVSSSAGNLFGFSIDAPDRFNVQHWIHSTISREAGYFEYPNDIQFRLRMSGFIHESKGK